MTRTIERRVGALEARIGGGCPECGDGGGGPESWEVVWVDPDEPAEPEWCEACGRPLAIVITWDDPPGAA